MKTFCRKVIMYMVIFSLTGCERSYPNLSNHSYNEGEIVTIKPFASKTRSPTTQKSENQNVDFTMRRENSSVIFFARQKDYPPERAREIITMSYPDTPWSIGCECRFTEDGVIYIFSEWHPSNAPIVPKRNIPVVVPNYIKVV